MFAGETPYTDYNVAITQQVARSASIVQGIIVKYIRSRMQPISSTTLSAARTLPFAEMREHIHQGLNDKLTGQIRAVFHSGITTTLFVHNGKVRQVYIRNHRTPNLNWVYPISLYGDGTLYIEPMPIRAILFKKVVLETPRQVSSKSAQTSQLHGIFHEAGHDPNPTLFHMKWRTAEGYVLVAGKNMSLQYAVALTESGASEGQVALNQLSAWEEAQCQLTTYHGDIKNQAWLEVHLGILFEWYCTKILNYYEQLTGSVMLQSILRRVYILALHEGWNIETQRKSLSDTSVFPNAAVAGRAYKRIFATIRHQIEPIIGSALAERIMQQAYNDLPKDIYKTIAEAFEITDH